MFFFFKIDHFFYQAHPLREGFLLFLFFLLEIQFVVKKVSNFIDLIKLVIYFLQVITILLIANLCLCPWLIRSKFSGIRLDCDGCILSFLFAFARLRPGRIIEIINFPSFIIMRCFNFFEDLFFVG